MTQLSSQYGLMFPLLEGRTITERTIFTSKGTIESITITLPIVSIHIDLNHLYWNGLTNQPTHTCQPYMI